MMMKIKHLNTKGDRFNHQYDSIKVWTSTLESDYHNWCYELKSWVKLGDYVEKYALSSHMPFPNGNKKKFKRYLRKNPHNLPKGTILRCCGIYDMMWGKIK